MCKFLFFPQHVNIFSLPPVSVCHSVCLPVGGIGFLYFYAMNFLSVRRLYIDMYRFITKTVWYCYIVTDYKCNNFSSFTDGFTPHTPSSSCLQIIEKVVSSVQVSHKTQCWTDKTIIKRHFDCISLEIHWDVYWYVFPYTMKSHSSANIKKRR